MAKEIDEIKELEKDLDVLTEQYLAAREDIRLESNAAERVLKERKTESLKNRMEETREKLKALKCNWEKQLHRIDFDLAEEIAYPVINRLKRTDSAALFLLQDSESLMGRYCVTRLRERLEDVSSDITNRPLESEAVGGCIDEAAILRHLAGSDQDVDVKTAITRLCRSVNGGIIFIKLSFNDNLEHRPLLLPWLKEQLWHNLVDHLCKLQRQGTRVRVVLIINHLQKLNTDSLDRSLFCDGDDFDQRRIVELPLEMWSKEVVKDWLMDHSKLRLTVPEAVALAEEICADCPTGLPYHVDTKLRKKLNQIMLDKKEPDE
jgi:hypothetical protein